MEKKITSIIRTHGGKILAIYNDGTTEAKTRDELAAIVEGNAIEDGAAASEAGYTLREIDREARRDKENDENRDRCKRIAEEVEAYASGSAYKCPYCGEVHLMSAYEESEHENEDGETVYTCPNCEREIEENDLEAVSLWDYFNDVYNIEYRIDQQKELRSVEIMVACGGPNIYIDTDSKSVKLYWGGEFAEYPIDYDTAAALTECGGLVSDLEAEINAQTAKQGGKKEAQAAALRILKTAEQNARDKLAKALTASDGAQMISDGFRAVKLSEALPIPQHADNAAADMARSIERFITEAAENVGEPITPPTVAELKNYITIKKAEAKSRREKLPYIPYKLAEGIGVDAVLLVDLLQILPDAVLIPSGVERWRSVRPLYLKAANGCGLLCPLRLPEEA